MRSAFVFSVIALTVLFFSFSGCNSLTHEEMGNDLSRFDVENIEVDEPVAPPIEELQEIKSEETEKTDTSSSSLPNTDELTKKLKEILPDESRYDCEDDADCVMIKEDVCCKCFYAINEDHSLILETIPLKTEKENCDCTGFPDCPSVDNYLAKCIANKCDIVRKSTAALDAEGEEKEEIITPDMVIYNVEPHIPSSSLFDEIVLKPACQKGFNSIYLTYHVKSISEVELEFLDLSGESAGWQSLATYESTFGKDVSVIICPTCNYYGYATIKPDTVYQMRLKATFKEEDSYSGIYTVDTSRYSEYMQKKCSS